MKIVTPVASDGSFTIGYDADGVAGYWPGNMAAVTGEFMPAHAGMFFLDGSERWDAHELGNGEFAWRCASSHGGRKAAAELRALRPVKTYRCAVCGATFAASDTRARYCSNKCRQAAKYSRRRNSKHEGGGSHEYA